MRDRANGPARVSIDGGAVDRLNSTASVEVHWGKSVMNFITPVDKLGIGKKHRKIVDGDKIKFVYLKEPNPIKDSVIAIVNNLPSEFKLDDYIDYDKPIIDLGPILDGQRLFPV